MTVTCCACGRSLETDFPGRAVCSCGSRLFSWEDGATKPTRINYERTAWAFGASNREAA